MKIVLYGTPILRKVSKKVEKIDSELNETLDEMIVTMRNAKGIGLAANQVGIDKRFFVLEIEDEIKKIINPEILEFSKELIEIEEGCLSLPGIYKKATRPRVIKVKYWNEKGEEVTEEMEDLWARAFQHELDHLDGILFIDKISPMSKRLISKKLDQLKKMSVEQ